MVDEVNAVIGVWRTVDTEVEQFDYRDGNDTLVIRVPRPFPGAIRKATQLLRDAQAEILQPWPMSERICRISSALAAWLDPRSVERQLAERWLPVMTGYAPNMVHRGLTRYLRTFLPDQLTRFLAQDLLDPAMLDHPVPDRAGGWSMAVGPRVLGQIVAGNIPGIALWHMVLGLLVKSAVITRVSRHEPLMAALTHQLIHRTDPELAQLLALVYWPAGDSLREEALFDSVDRLVIYGSNSTISDIRQRVAGRVPVVGYGHRVSLTVIGREALEELVIDDTVRRTGRDVALWDQASCASPHAILVEEGGKHQPKELAERLAAELERWEIKEPRGPVPADVAHAIRDWADQWEWTSNVSVWHHPDYRWAVVAGDPASVPIGPMNRTAFVIPISNLDAAVLPWFRRLVPYLQTVGVAIPRRRLFPLLSSWARAGVTRITEVGRMHEFPAGWLHDGGHSVADLVSFMGVDPGTLESLDTLDRDTW
ncbi:MAG: hypothetical protein OWU33_15795 [Firmicutes bacterium]|nr:hypothetical protein [Bacillota bacterium]